MKAIESQDIFLKGEAVPNYCHSQQLAVPHSDEWACFARTLVEIRANRADAEEGSVVELSAQL